MQPILPSLTPQVLLIPPSFSPTLPIAGIIEEITPLKDSLSISPMTGKAAANFI